MTAPRRTTSSLSLAVALVVATVVSACADEDDASTAEAGTLAADGSADAAAAGQGLDATLEELSERLAAIDDAEAARAASPRLEELTAALEGHAEELAALRRLDVSSVRGAEQAAALRERAGVLGDVAGELERIATDVELREALGSTLVGLSEAVLG